ncbi:MAG: hypothetical protein N2053_02860 [Chitinispirillaceae bacterium]|nr:hypothetical protein [Chitinispirillaceae bacterium]
MSIKADFPLSILNLPLIREAVANAVEHTCLEHVSPPVVQVYPYRHSSSDCCVIF